MSFRIRIERTAAPASTTRRRSLTVAATTAVAIVLVGGVSYAFWTATGSGSATVGATTAQVLTVTASSPVVSDLYPGKAKQALTFSVNNPNPYPVLLNNTATVTAGTSSNEGTCAAATNLNVTAGPYTLVGTLTVPASGSVSLSINNFVQMASGAGDACQGKTFTFPVSVTGTQQ